MIRIGFGYDVHRLVSGRRLILGGVEIPFGKGLEGHSDADVLIHAVIDALLGALALDDIGTHFPDTDPAHLNADSRSLLRQVYRGIKEKGYTLGNLDCTVCLAQPRLRPYVEQIRLNLAADLECAPQSISVKAKTENGITGSGEGVSCYSAVLVASLGEPELAVQEDADPPQKKALQRPPAQVVASESDPKCNPEP